MITYKALSAPTDLDMSYETSGHVLSVHADHLNISLPEGIITLQRCGSPLIPFGIEVEAGEGWCLSPLVSGLSVCYTEGRLIIGDQVVVEGIEACSRRSSRPSISTLAAPEDIIDRLTLLDRLCRRSEKQGGILTYLEHYRFEGGSLTKQPASGVLKREMGRRFELLLAGIAQNDNFLINEGIHGFLGLGPGLTPSGDDFLVGFLCGIMYLPIDGYRAGNAKLAQCLAQDAPLLTTALSAEYIKYAAHGSFHAYFLKLLHAVCLESEQEMLAAGRALLSLGHHSGTDLLLGFVYGGMSAIHLSKGEKI